MNKVQEALKAAIEALEDAGTHTVFSYDATIDDCKSALSEIEKCEPVRYEWFDEHSNEWIETSKTYYLQYSYDHPVRMLYTSPISKEWVVIDEETIDDIGNTLSDEQGFIPVETWTEFARAIEAKLKQLNVPEKG